MFPAFDLNVDGGDVHWGAEEVRHVVVIVRNCISFGDEDVWSVVYLLVDGFIMTGKRTPIKTFLQSQGYLLDFTYSFLL